jgi:hypothetical protein
VFFPYVGHVLEASIEIEIPVRVGDGWLDHRPAARN